MEEGDLGALDRLKVRAVVVLPVEQYFALESSEYRPRPPFEAEEHR